jgi:iron complex transport system ATP-binding protein
MVLVKARNVSFRYQRDWVLKDVNFTLNRGELFGLIGPNGSGKTTFLKVISGVLTPPQGEVRFDDRTISSWNRNRLAQKMAMVSQETPFDFPFSVLEVVLMGRYPHLGSLEFEGEHDLAIAKESMGLLEVHHLENRLMSELSGGERQRALVARALSQKPVCLLMDEPTAFLDLRHQLDLFILTRDLVRSGGLGALVISHDINLAAQFCDQLILLDRGEIVVQGPPQRVILTEHLEPVYGCRLVVDRSPVSGTPRVTPLPSPGDSQTKE